MIFWVIYRINLWDKDGDPPATIPRSTLELNVGYTKGTSVPEAEKKS